MACGIIFAALKMQSASLRRREPDLGVINPVLDLESTYALPVFIESLVEGAFAFPRWLADICDSIRLIAFHWAKVEQTKECGIWKNYPVPCFQWVGWVAQLVEQRTENPSDEGRTPFHSVSLRLTKTAFNPVFIGDSYL